MVRTGCAARGMSIEPKHTAKKRNSFECCGMALDEPEGEALDKHSIGLIGTSTKRQSEGWSRAGKAER